MMAHGFALGILQALVLIGLATVVRRTVPSGELLIEVIWMEVTEAGRQAVAG
jgi:hypothetical protein